MPPKIRELVAQLEATGFVNRGDKGSHRNFVHPSLPKLITISGQSGMMRSIYQVRAIRAAIEELKK